MPDRPNVLFVVIDQFRADCLTGALTAHLRLPHLQALRDEAVTFRQHYAVCNPCGPSRASLLTGQYAMNHRAVRNGTPLAHDTPTLGTEARKAGYRPMLFGYSDISRDPRAHHPKDPDLQSYEQVAAGFDEIVEMRLEESYPWRAHLKAKGYDLPPYREFYVPQGDDPLAPAFYRAEDSDTAFLTDCVLQDLAVRPPGWFAHVTYIRPHPPFVAPTPYNTMYDPEEMPAPLMPGGDVHPFVAAVQQSKTAADCVDGLKGLDSSAETIAKLRALYFGLATEVDHHIGRIIAFLKESGQWDNTLLVVTADHGEMLGDHDLWGKTSFHDAAFHTPLIIRDPDHPAQHGQNVDALTESIDVSPTILSHLGLLPPDTMDGRSLAPFLRGQVPDDWRSSSMSELEFGDPIAPNAIQRALGLPCTQSALCVLRNATHTLVHFSGALPPILLDHETGADIAQDAGAAPTLLRMTQTLLEHRMGHPQSRFAHTLITSDGLKHMPRHTFDPNP